MGDKLDEINRLNIRIAKEAAAEFSTPDRPRFVIGSIGPGTKMPSLTDPAIYADFDTLADAYRPQIRVMIEERRRRDPDRDVLRHPPGEVRGDHRHRGDEADRASGCRSWCSSPSSTRTRRCCPAPTSRPRCVALDPLDEIDVIGMNCGVGPDLMLDDIRHLSRHSDEAAQRAAERRAAARRAATRRTSRSTRNALADWLERFVTEFGVEHRRRLLRHHGRAPEGGRATASAARSRAARSPKYVPAVSSLQSSQELHQRSAAAARRRADQHQRLAEVQATARKGRLARPRRDGPGAGARGRPRPRRVRRLRRPRRRPRHEGGHQALQRGAHQADHARQHRSAGHRGGAEAVQRQDDHQLDQPRRRPQDARPEDDRSPRSTGRRSSR